VSFGLLILGQESDGRKELTGRVFSINSVFEGMSIDLDIILFEAEFVASRDKNLLFN